MQQMIDRLIADLNGLDGKIEVEVDPHDVGHLIVSKPTPWSFPHLYVHVCLVKDRWMVESGGDPRPHRQDPRYHLALELEFEQAVSMVVEIARKILPSLCACGGKACADGSKYSDLCEDCRYH